MTKLFSKLSHSPLLFACLGFLASHFLHAEKVRSRALADYIVIWSNTPKEGLFFAQNSRMLLVKHTTT